LNNVVSYSEDLSNQTTIRNTTKFDISALVFEAGSSPFNLTYADWTAKWWQWAYSIPQGIHPAYDDTGKFCKVRKNLSGISQGHINTQLYAIVKSLMV
jgi:hypothetical protein